MRKALGGRKNKIKDTNNPRYIKVEEQLDTEIGRQLRMGHLARLNVPDISRKAKVWKSTFYNHFLHLDDALRHFNHKMKPNLKQLAKETQADNYSLEVAFNKILFFVYNNDKYYKTIVYCNDLVPILEIAKTFRPIITKGWSNYGEELTEKSFIIFSWEMGSLIYYWGSQEKFDKAKIAEHARYLTRLASNATQRLN